MRYYDDLNTFTFHGFVALTAPGPTTLALAAPGLLLLGAAACTPRRRRAGR